VVQAALQLADHQVRQTPVPVAVVLDSVVALLAVMEVPEW
jgi:hypothetical protein